VFVASLGTFETRETDALNLGFEGIEGDFHAGYTRRSGGGASPGTGAARKSATSASCRSWLPTSSAPLRNAWA
jgi:hypothetical protein